MLKTIEPKILKQGEGEQLRVLVDNITVKVDKSETGGLFTVVETNNEPDAGVPPHYHTNEDEFFYVVEGEVEFMVNGETIIARDGDSVYGPRNIPHAYRFLKQTKMLVTIVPGGFEEMFREVHNMADQSNLDAVVATFNKYGVFLVE